MEDNGLPSRTSILTAAARAFGSRETDASVPTPIGPRKRLIGSKLLFEYLNSAGLELLAKYPTGMIIDIREILRQNVIAVYG